MAEKIERILSSKQSAQEKRKRLNELESNILILQGIIDEKHSHGIIDDNSYFKQQKVIFENQTPISYLAEIKKAKTGLKEHASHHNTFFSFLVLVIALSAIFFNPVFTGLVTGQSTTEILELNQEFSENTTIPLNLTNVSYIAISGSFEGENIKIIAQGKEREYTLYETRKKSSPLITGNVVGSSETEANNETVNETEEIIKETNNKSEEIIPELILNETNTTINETILENSSEEIINITVNETILSNSSEINISEEFNITNETIEENVSLEINITINETENQSSNETIINITINETSNQSSNGTETISPEIPVNETINESIQNETEEINEILILTDECGRGCLLANEEITSIKIISDGKGIISNIKYKIPKQTDIEQIQQIENTELLITETLEINVQKYFKGAEYFDTTSSEGYTSTYEDNKLTIKPETIGIWKAQIYASNGEDLITSNEFLIHIINSTNASINETNTSINLTNSSELVIIQEPAEINKAVRWKVTGPAEKVKEVKDKLPKVARIVQEEKQLDKEFFIYETPAPQSKIRKEKESSFIQEITAEENVTNVTAYLDVPEGITKEGVNIYWFEEEQKIENYWLSDENNNGLNDRIYYLVPHLSNQTFEINISILNVQSYPIVGGTWEVRFTTVGEAELTISAIEETSYGTESPDDLTPLSLKCGEETKSFNLSGNTANAGTWSCNETAYWTVKVLTAGVHDQEFTFGNLTAEAHNDAANIPVTESSRISPAQPGTSNDLLGYCNATDADTGDQIVYSWKWYKNNILFSEDSNEEYWCYQESFNSSTVNDGNCELNYSGNFYTNELVWTNPENSIDGNWSTTSTFPGPGTNYMYINYSKPNGALNTSLWQGKTNNYGTVNRSIPQDCWTQEPLQLRMGRYEGGGYDTMFECMNSTGWYLININSGDDKLYEEGMWWRINAEYHTESTETNINNISSASTSVDDEWILSCKAYDGFNESSWMNSSAITIKGNPPTFTWENPTPTDAETISTDYAYLNTTITDSSETSAFFDWGNDLLGYWSFDNYDGTYVYDNSSYGFNAGYQLSASSNNITAGKFGNGFSSNSTNEYVSISDKPEHSKMDQLSMEVWLKAPATGFRNVIYKTSSFLINIRSNNKVRVDFYNDTTYTAVGTNTVIADGTWHHIVGTYNGTHVRAYVDGQLDQELPHTGTIRDSGTVFVMGRNTGGTIDEVRLYNRTLSPEEVKASYNNSLYRLQNNFTNLASDTTYTYKAYAIDKAGNLNISEERSVTVGAQNTPPDTPTVTINTSLGNDNYDEDLQCWATITDPDSDYLNVSVNWYKNGILDLSTFYNNYANNTLFNASLNMSLIPFHLDPYGNHSPNDFSIFYENGWYHAYYIKDDMGFNKVAFGYEKSQDLTHWSFVDNVMYRNTSSNWMQGQVWAPHVIDNGSNYLMFYTGVDAVSGSTNQRIALASSTDLVNWENVDVNNCPGTDYQGCIWDCNLTWTTWEGDGADWNDDCRDPMVFTDDYGMNFMVYTTRDSSRGATVGIANSSNFVDWTDMGGINVTSAVTAESDLAESPFLWEEGGKVYLYWVSDNSPYYYISSTYISNISESGDGQWSTPIIERNGSYANEILNLTASEGFNLWAELPEINYNISFYQSEINSTDNSTIVSSLPSSILKGYTSPGEDWSCSIRLYDGVDFGSWGSSSNITITDINNPSVTLISPSDSQVSTNSSWDFSCSVTDNSNIYNVSLWTNISGTWEENQTWDARSHTNDANTTFLARFDGDYLTEEGESPATQTGTSITTGKIGQSTLIDGTDTLSYPVSNNMNADKGTLEFWVYPTEDWNDISSDNIKFLFNTNTFELYMDGTADGDEIVWAHDGGAPSVQSTPQAWDANTWYHIAFTYDFDIDEYKLYINGNLEDTVTTSKTAPSLGTNFFIGSHNSGDYYVDSRIDDIRISNKVLSSAEINYSINQSKKSLTANFTINNIPEGDYVWSCIAKDEYDNSGTAASNYSFNVAESCDGTGDWTPSGNLSCANKNIVVDSLTVSAGNTLTLNNSNLTVNGNTDIHGSFDFINSRNSLWQNGNLTINGTFNLTNATLRMNGSSDGEVGINVTSTGTLIVNESSNITNGETASANYWFRINNGATANIEDSYVYEAGWTSTGNNGGLWIDSPITIDNSSFMNHIGLILTSNADYSNITNSRMIGVSTSEYGIYSSNTNNLVLNNINVTNISYSNFGTTTYGISLNGIEDSILNNILIDKIEPPAIVQTGVGLDIDSANRTNITNIYLYNIGGTEQAIGSFTKFLEITNSDNLIIGNIELENSTSISDSSSQFRITNLQNSLIENISVNITDHNHYGFVNIDSSIINNISSYSLLGSKDSYDLDSTSENVSVSNLSNYYSGITKIDNIGGYNNIYSLGSNSIIINGDANLTEVSSINSSTGGNADIMVGTTAVANIYNSVINNPSDSDIETSSCTTGSLHIYNSTYNRNNVGTIESSCYVESFWYYDLTVLNQFSEGINNANLLVNNTFSSEVLNVNTTSGSITQQVIKDFFKNASETTYYNNHTILVQKPGFDDYTDEKNFTSSISESVTLSAATNTCYPDSSANWIVNQGLSCSDITITAYNTNVASSGNVSLVNVTLNVRNSSSISGNFSIRNSSNTIWHNGNIYVYGLYELISSNLKMNGTSDGSSGIYVNQSGTFIANESSNITNGLTSSAQYAFEVNGSLTLNNTNISQAGWTGTGSDGGLYINGLSSIDNSFLQNHVGIILGSSADNSEIYNSRIIGLSNSEYGLYGLASGLTIQNLNVSSIEYNAASSNNYGMFLSGVDSSSLSNIRITDIVPLGSGSTTYGLYLSNTDTATINGVYINNVGGSNGGYLQGIYVYNSDNIDLYHVLINNSPAPAEDETHSAIIFDISQYNELNNITVEGTSTSHFIFNDFSYSNIYNLLSREGGSLTFSLNKTSLNNNVSNLSFYDGNNLYFNGINQTYTNVLSQNNQEALVNGDNAVFNNFTSHGAGVNGLTALNSANITLFNSLINNSASNNLQLGSSSCSNSNVTLYNTSLLPYSTNILNGPNCFIQVYWYVNVYVNNTDGQNVQNAEVNVTNITGSHVIDELTAVSGLTSTYNISQLYEDNNSLTTANNHTFNASKTNQGSTSISVNVSKSMTVNLTIESNNVPRFGNEYLRTNSVYKDGDILYDGVSTYTLSDSSTTARAGSGVINYPRHRSFFDFEIGNISLNSSVTYVSVGLALETDKDTNVALSNVAGRLGAVSNSLEYNGCDDSIYGSNIATWNTPGVNNFRYQSLGSNGISDFQDDLSQGYFGICVRNNVETGTRTLNEFYTSEHASTQYHPRLNVTFVIKNFTWETINSISPFDLDDFFSDPDGDNTLNYTFEGNSSIQISVNASNHITFTPTTDFTGSETINITATDPYSATAISNNFVLTVYSRPSISNLQSSPEPQGYGIPVEINATITDAEGVSSALVEIDSVNYTMSNIVGNIWQYNYTGWTNGTHSYKVWANSTNGYWNSSSGSSFNLNVDAQVRVETEESSYDQNEIVNITDSSYSEINQSIVNNTYSTNFVGYIYMITKFWNATQSLWIDDTTVINDVGPYQINTSSNLSLSSIWDGNYNTSSAGFGAGTYQVYVEVRDNESNLLQTLDGSYLNHSYTYYFSNNTIPTIDYVNLTPITAYTTNDLLLNATCVDYNIGDSLTVHYELYKDGINQTSLTGNTGVTNNVNSLVSTIDSSNTAKGEEWSARARCYDGTTYGDWVWINNNITIQNTDPSISYINIGPSTAYTNNNLLVNLTCTDPDSSDSLTADYELYKDGINQTSLTGNTGISSGINSIITNVSHTEHHNGEEWSARARCYDGTTYTSWNQVSSNVTIQNYSTSLVIENSSNTTFINIPVSIYANYTKDSGYSVSGISSEIGALIWQKSYDVDVTAVQTFDCSYTGEKNCLAVGINQSSNQELYMYERDGTSIYSRETNSIVNSIKSSDLDKDNYSNDFTILTLLSLRTYNETTQVDQINFGGTFDGGISSIHSDLDNDGDNEIIYGTKDGEIVAYYYNLTQKWLRDVSGSTAYITELESADFNKDGYNDIIAIGYASALYAINGTGGEILWNTGDIEAATIAVLDLDNDGIKDEIAVGINANDISFYNESGSFLFTHSLSGVNGVRDLFVGDLDGDGYEDDIYTNEDAQNINLACTESSCVQTWITSEGSCGRMNIFGADINDDGLTDFIGGTSCLRVFDNDGSYIQTYETGGTIGDNSFGRGDHSEISSGDFDGDGINDLAFGSTDTNLYVVRTAACVVNFNDSSTYNMTWSTSLNKWELNVSFDTGGYFDYNITCNKGGYETQALSNTLFVDDRIPVMQEVRIEPVEANIETELIGYCNASHALLKNVTYYYNWYKNGVLNYSGNEGGVNYTQGLEVNVDNVSTSLLEIGDVWVLECRADDGTFNSSWMNSTATNALFEVSVPEINWTDPTPADSENIGNQNYSYLNTSIYDNSEFSSFFDFDKDLLIYLNFEYYNSTGVYDNSSYEYFANYRSASSSDINDTSNIRGNYFTNNNVDNKAVVINDNSNISGLTQITLSAWIKINDWDQAGYKWIAGKSEYAGQREYRLRFNPSSSNLHFFIDNDGTGGANSASLNIAELDLPIDTWHHIVGTWTNETGNMSVYLNGDLYDSTTFSQSSLFDGTADFTVGSSSDNGGTPSYMDDFDGSIDEVLLFKRALSPEEVKALHNGTANRLYHNFTDLSYGTHNYSAYAIDEYGNLKITTTRQFTSQANFVPDTPSISINSSLLYNSSSEDLYCWATITDADADTLNATVKWYKNGIEDQSTDYNNSYTNGTLFNASLGSGNTTLGDDWSCSIRTYDGTDYSSLGYSSNLTIINAAPVVDEARISPTLPASNDDLAGYCNASDLDGDSIFYYWQWWQDGSLYSSDYESAGSSYCYQETANVANGCGALGTGSYGSSGSWANLANTYDGNYGNFGFDISGGISYLYINYSKPSGSDRETSKWQVKPGSTSSNTVNYTIPLDCWNQEPLQLRIYSDGGWTEHESHCWSGSTWTRISGTFEPGSSIYEEGMWWNISSTGHTEGLEYNVENISSSVTTVGEEWILSCLAYDGTENSTWVNSTAVTITNGIPDTPTVYINSTDGTNRSNQDLNCWATITDPDADTLNATVKWYKNGIEDQSYDYNSSYANGTRINSSLGSANTSADDKWSCSIRTFDGYNYSSISFSNNITIIDNNAISDCVDISSSGNYYLTNSITNTATNYCINISANNVEVDCQGYTIDANDLADYGIYTYRSSETSTNVTINNCVLNDWDTSSIHFENSNDNNVQNISITSSTDSLIRLLYSDYNIINNVSTVSGTYSVHLDYSNYNNVSNLSSSGTNSIFYFDNSENNTLSDSIINNSATSSITLENSKGNYINNNLAGYTSTNIINLVVNNETYCDNTVNNLTTPDNKEVRLYNSSASISNLNNLTELILCDADYSTINNITINNSLNRNNRGKVELVFSDYVNVTNSEIHNAYYGTNIRDSTSIIVDNSYYYGSNYGIYSSGLYISLDNLAINNSNFSTTSASGTSIRIDDSSGTNIVFENLLVEDFLNEGIYLRTTESGSNSVIKHSFIKNGGGGSGDNAVYIRGDIDFINNTIENNTGRGLYIYRVSSSDLVNNSIVNNSAYGVYFYQFGYSSPSYFYNNFFNNSENFIITGTATNYLNTSLKFGDRIYSDGPLIGGNFYATPAGQGWSLNCTDADTDGFCDSSVTIGTGLVDYLPLSDEYVNVDPSITYINLTPVSVYTNEDLFLNSTCLESTHENFILSVYYEIYKDGINQTSLAGSNSISNNSNTLLQTIDSSNTQKNEEWSARVRCYDGDSYSAWTWLNNNVTIQNSVPSTPSLIYPINNTITSQRFFNFNWTESSDLDTDTLSYEINITNPSGVCYTTYTTGISTSNWTNPLALCVNDNDFRVYNWTVRAYDGQDYSSWADFYNLSIDSVVDILLLDNSSDLGSIDRDGTNNTLNTSDAFEIKNNGNVYLNLSLAAETSLWSSVTLNSSYFQYLAQDNESNSFNSTLTPSGWLNVSNISSILAADLNWENSSDQIFIHFQATGPHEEPPGVKTSTLNITGEYTHD